MTETRMLYKASCYARASKDDDSGTIENQHELIAQFARSRQDIQIVSQYSDNGYSGVDFLRPAFAEMMREIEAGSTNCVIVKDLSRLGRNYIEVGELMEAVFPRLGVRLIAVNDGYDSLNPRTDSEEIIIPFKNLINEQYLRDASVKTRTNLKAKMQKGEYVGANPPYGYTRDFCDKHQLVIDPFAAEVVREIFRMKIYGQSQQSIADELNRMGVPSPAGHRELIKAKPSQDAKACWSPVAVGRILRNQTYTGDLIQGKCTTPSYKVKKRIEKPVEQWCVTRNAHQAIVSKHDFEVVRGLLASDTRTSPSAALVYPLSGMIYCGDCGNSVVRKKVDKYSYYVCATHKAKQGCASHSYSADKLEGAVFAAVNLHARAALETETYYGGLPHALTRQLAVCLISRVDVYENKRIKISFRFADKLKEVESMLN